MSGWQRPEVAFDPNHAPMANLPMIRFSRHDIESARYRVKRKKRTAEKNSRTGKSDPQGAADKQCPKPGKINRCRGFPAYGAPTYPYEPGRGRATVFVIGASGSTPADMTRRATPSARRV